MMAVLCILIGFVGGLNWVSSNPGLQGLSGKVNALRVRAVRRSII